MRNSPNSVAIIIYSSLLTSSDQYTVFKAYSIANQSTNVTRVDIIILQHQNQKIIIINYSKLLKQGRIMFGINKIILQRMASS